jgi:hypothetical protein
MRNRPYAYALGQDPKSIISGKFGVTVLPKKDLGRKRGSLYWLRGWEVFEQISALC